MGEVMTGVAMDFFADTMKARSLFVTLENSVARR